MTAVAGACLVLGCLPVGEPPAGQQLVRDRTLTAVFFSSSESDAEPSFLFCTGPYRTSGAWLTSLYAVSYGKDVGVVNTLASLEPAIEDLAPLSFSIAGTSPPTDSLGRLFLTTPAGQGAISTSWEAPYGVTRFDPRTGAREPVPSGTVLRFSRSRSRVFAGGSTAATLFEPEGSRPLVGVSGLPVFVGEDFYYVAVSPSDTPGRSPTSSTLTRIKPNAEPEAILATPGYLTIVTVLQGVGATRLLVQQGAVPGVFVLDVDTLTSTPFSSEAENLRFESASSSGRWLLFVSITVPSNPAVPPSETKTIVDSTTGRRTDLDWTVFGEMGLNAPSSGEWRPGHDELWLRTERGAFTITEPGDLVTALPLGPGLALAPLPQAGTNRFSFFTSDGRHWFSRNPSFDGQVSVGRADDPSSATLPINPKSTWTKPYWEIGDGRLLMGAWADDEARQELYLVDPAAATSLVLAGGGQLVAVGRTRALALLEWDGARDTGALTLIDLASGAKTLLADEVYAVAVDPGRSADAPPGFDALAPGTKIAFLTRGRMASSYDGLWVTELP